MAFSPSGRVLCVGVSPEPPPPGTASPGQRSRLDFYVLPKKKDTAAGKKKTKHARPIHSLVLDTSDPIVGLCWHHKLNQVLVATTKAFWVYYSVEHSTKGVLLTVGRRNRHKRSRMEEGLQDVYQARAPPPGSTVRYDEIVAPNALPLFGGESRHKKRKEKEEAEEAKQHPQQPAKSVYNTHNTMFAQMIVDNQTVEQKIIAGKDPREALAKYSEGKSYISSAYEGNKERILAERTVEEDEDEMKK